MECFGDTSLLRDLHQPSVLLSTGKKRRRALIVLAGGTAGATSAEVLRALDDTGIKARHFDVIVGVSAGAFNAAAYAAGDSAQVRGVYENVCMHMYAVSLTGGGWRLFDELAHIMRETFNQEAARQNPSELRVVLTDLVGKFHLYDAKKPADMVDALLASASVPWFTNGTPLEGKIWVDGACGHPCPLAYIAREFRPHDVLVVGSRARPEHQHWVETWSFPFVVHTFMMWHSWALKTSTVALDQKLDETLALFKSKRRKMRLTGIFPTGESAIFPLEARGFEIAKKGDEAYAYTRKLLDTHR